MQAAGVLLERCPKHPQLQLWLQPDVSGLLDYSQPLDTQLCSEDSSLTWQQFFLGEALNYWQMYQSLALEAKNAGMEMPAEDREYLDGLELLWRRLPQTTAFPALRNCF